MLRYLTLLCGLAVVAGPALAQDYIDLEQERSNPGEQDCTLQLNETTWTALKNLFSR